MKYMVPEYYDRFQCKCGACRHSCCDGWPIRISMKEYYHLLSIPCSGELRTKLDCALKLCKDNHGQGYVQISTNWQGICMLHLENGLCALQSELGEEVLPTVCRQYPRSTKELGELRQCSCSNSCEAVIELLMKYQNPLLQKDVDLLVSPELKHDLTAEQIEVFYKCITILQNRQFPMHQRYLQLAQYFNLDEIWGKFEQNEACAVDFLLRINRYFLDSNLSEYCQTTLDYYELGGQMNMNKVDIISIKEKYRKGQAHLNKLLPDWSILLEQLIINHMFYNNFPFCNNYATKDSYTAFIIMTSFLEFNLMGCMVKNKGITDLVDFLSAMFRIIEHSNFYDIALSLCQMDAEHNSDVIRNLISLFAFEPSKGKML